MSRANGEKARAAIAKRNKTARRVKDRAALAEIRRTAAAKTEQPAAPKKARKSPSA